MTLFTVQGDPGDPATAHSFGLFARESSTDDGQTWELVHINWIPPWSHRSGRVCTLFEVPPTLCQPEEGTNEPVTGAIELADLRSYQTVKFGPVEISESLYLAARQQDLYLRGKGGRPKPLYKAMDAGGRETYPPSYLNCFHALSDMVRNPTGLPAVAYDPSVARMGAGFFIAATAEVARHLRPWMLRHEADENVWDELADQLWPLPGPRPSILRRIQDQPLP